MSTEDTLKASVRRLALNCLDDEDGMTYEQFQSLLAVIVDLEFTKSFVKDVLDKVVEARGRYFLNEDSAQEIRLKDLLQ